MKIEKAKTIVKAQGDNIKVHPIGSGGIVRWFCTNVAAVLGMDKKHARTGTGIPSGKSSLTTFVLSYLLPISTRT